MTCNSELSAFESDFCTQCGGDIFPESLKQTGNKCATCRDGDAIYARRSWCVAPMHKSNYMLITNRQDLTGLNNKGGLVK